MNVKLLVINGKQQGMIIPVRHGQHLFGRGDECLVRFKSDMVSRQHCALRVEGDEVTVRDLGSCNGTLVNGVLIQDEQPLQHGDELQVYPLAFKVLLKDLAETNSAMQLLNGDTMIQ